LQQGRWRASNHARHAIETLPTKILANEIAPTALTGDTQVN
jgi:hypothetical protein